MFESLSPGPDELPILGEPFAVELANTWYRAGDEYTDFLGDDLMRAWFAHAPEARGVRLPRRLPASAAAGIRDSRDAVRQLLEAAADGERPAAGSRSMARLDRASRTAPAFVRLDLEGDAFEWSLDYQGSGGDTVLAEVAGRCILFLGDARIADVRRCARPTCSMLFVQRHRSRRFCHESCAHRVRQARYYRATR